MLTIEEARRKLGLGTKQPVYKAIYDCRLKAHQDAFGGWWVDEKELERFRKSRYESRQSFNSVAVKFANTLDEMNERLERIELALKLERFKEPRPEFKPPRPNGLNVVEEKDV